MLIGRKLNCRTLGVVSMCHNPQGSSDYYMVMSFSWWKTTLLRVDLDCTDVCTIEYGHK